MGVYNIGYLVDLIQSIDPSALYPHSLHATLLLCLLILFTHRPLLPPTPLLLQPCHVVKPRTKFCLVYYFYPERPGGPQTSSSELALTAKNIHPYFVNTQNIYMNVPPLTCNFDVYFSFHYISKEIKLWYYKNTFFEMDITTIFNMLNG